MLCPGRDSVTKLPRFARSSFATPYSSPVVKHAGALLLNDTMNTKCQHFFVLAFCIYVPRAGLEPARCNQPRILSPLCLPFHHPGNMVHNIYVMEVQAGVEPANGGFANRSVRPLRHCTIHFIHTYKKFFHSSIFFSEALEKIDKSWYSINHI